MKKTTILLDDDVAANADAVKRLLHITLQKQVGDGLAKMYRDKYRAELRAKAKRGFAQVTIG